MIPQYLMRKTEKERARTRRNRIRRFAAWDGEGVVHPGRNDMSYILFGAVIGDGTDYKICGKQLSTVACLDHIMKIGTGPLRDFIHVSFAFTFDVDQMLRDIPVEKLLILKETNSLHWQKYRIKYIPRKFIEITVYHVGKVTIYDAFTFFACSFINACEQYIPGHHLMDAVHKGKDKRESFTYADLPYIVEYWRMEGQMMVALMDALRDSMTNAGIPLSKWYGPGAVASALLSKHRLKSHIKQSRYDQPEQVLRATAYAYFGGRFENFQIGRIPGPIYSYDLRSAYPACLARMPGLIGGEWVHTTDIDDWGIYRVLYDASVPNPLGIGPFPTRGRDGSVSYGLSADGWYYGHEVKAALMAGFKIIDVIDGWRYLGSSSYPFEFVRELYVQRAEWKAQGNPAQLAAKLGMNSIYGKLCQTVGWNESTYEPPPLHNQWYAGHITSWCRARILNAIMQNPEAIIAIETDGIYSTAPLKLPISTQLGDWEENIYDEVIYVQNGVYFLAENGIWEKQKVRGIGSTDVSLDDVISHLPLLEPLETTVHRYGSMGGFIGREKHYTWYDQKRSIIWGGEGKRRHLPEMCVGCHDKSNRHLTVMSRPFSGKSSPRYLPWLDDAPNRYQTVT